MIVLNVPALVIEVSVFYVFLLKLRELGECFSIAEFPVEPIHPVYASVIIC